MLVRLSWPALSSALLLTHVSVVAAQESAYCRKVKARAEADSLLLMTPKVVAQALRFPSSGRIGVSDTTASDDSVELRAGLTYSPVDAWRGILLRRIGDADCRQHAAGSKIDEVLIEGTDRLQLAARRAELGYLTLHRSEWLALLDAANGELEAGLLTVTEVFELHRLTQSLERRLTDAELDVARLEVKIETPNASLPVPLGRNYLEQADEFEREGAALRRLDPWSFTITGGVVPLGHDAPDWFGFAEVSYSLGSLARGSAESRYLEAQSDELRTAPHELPSKLAHFRKLVAADLANAKRALERVRSELLYTQSTLQKLLGVDAPSASTGRAQVTLERIAVEADEVILRVQIRELSALAEGIRES